MASYLSDFNLPYGPVGADITFLSGTGTIVGNKLRLLGGSPIKIAARTETLTRDNYVCSIKFTLGPSFSSSQRPGLAFRLSGTSTYYYVSLKSGTFGNIYLYRYKNFTQTLLQQHPAAANINIPVNTQHTLEISVSGTTNAVITVTFNGQVIINSYVDNADPILTPGRVAAYLNDTAGDYVDFDDLSVVEGQATPVVDIIEGNQTLMAGKGLSTQQINLTAVASDEEDGNITANITWETSLDGVTYSPLGQTGGAVSYTLQLGTNYIRATIIDSALTSSQEQIIITLNPFDFGGITPIANGFILGDAAQSHTADTYTGNGIRVCITKHPVNGHVFVSPDGKLIALMPDTNTLSFSYRLEDQEGIGNEATITLNKSL